MDPKRYALLFLAICLTVVSWTSSVSTLRAGSATSLETSSIDLPPTTPAEFIDLFAAAYAGKNLDLYGTLLAAAPRDGIEFRFVLFEPSERGETEWGYDEEMRIHRRMFRPDIVVPGEKPVPTDLWPVSIDVQLEPTTGWSERVDLYRSEQNPQGALDRHRWRASEAVYETAVTWQTRGRGVLAIAGQARFVVVEDLQHDPDARRFLIYEWEDLGPGNVARTLP